MKGKYFILHANCISVKGANRSSICDLQRNRIRFIPNLLYDVLDLSRKMSVAEIKSHNSNTLDTGIDKYFEILDAEGFGFFTDEPSSFPPINLKWDSPLLITNAIIDFDNASSHPFEKIVKELSELGCSSLQLRFYCGITIEELNLLLTPTINTRINSIELIIKRDDMDIKDIKSLCNSHMRIRSILLYSSERSENTYLEGENVRLYYTTTRIDSEAHCGVINPAFFSANISHFSESKLHNSCLNRKISVDKKGNIKNCPSSTESFGNIKTSTLMSAINNKSFIRKWDISKDQISVCKDCEFRYVCTDCRMYLVNEMDIYSKPKKCNYDPYTSTWK
ncbi:MAG: grasp-with-spasm system SPASM domain peptide maturase [Cyclobacteriaceae bacterium]